MTKKKIILLWMLAIVPISIIAQLLHLNPLVIFITSGLAIIPLAAWIANSSVPVPQTGERQTESLAVACETSYFGMNAFFRIPDQPPASGSVRRVVSDDLDFLVQPPQWIASLQSVAPYIFTPYRSVRWLLPSWRN